MGKSVTFIDGYSVRDTITGVHHNTSGTSRGVQGQYSLDGNVHSWCVEGLKHDLCHLFSVGFRVQWGLSKKYWVFFWGHTELVVKSVMPDLLHIVPVGDNTVFNWVLEGEDTSLGLGLITDIAVLLSHTNHHTLERVYRNMKQANDLEEGHVRQLRLVIELVDMLIYI